VRKKCESCEVLECSKFVLKFEGGEKRIGQEQFRLCCALQAPGEEVATATALASDWPIRQPCDHFYSPM
jgi:hypothetical protein